MKIYIDGQEFAPERIRAWEAARVVPMRQMLEKSLGKPCRARNAEEFAAYKAALASETMRAALKSRTDLIGTGTRAVAVLSGKRRKISVAEIDVDFCDAKTLHELYFDMMLHNTPENLLCSLRANPEHFLVRGIDETTQEVIEISGGIPAPVRFFIRYGDESHILTPRDSDYPYQACGVSYLPSSLAIGAVRHQMKDTPEGCHVKLMVEFPALMPDKNIKEHQYHLACEFYNWFTEFERRVKQ